MDGLSEVQGVIDNISNIHAWISGADGLLNPESVTALSSSISGLNLQQAQLALSTKNLTQEQMNQVLAQAGLIASEDTIQSELLQTTLAQSSLSAEKQKAILVALGLMDATTGELFSTEACTKEKLLEILATKGVTGANAEAIVSSLGLAEANAVTSISFELLTKSIWANIKAMAKWLVTNPVGWAILAAGAIAGLVAICDAFTTSLSEAKNNLENSITTFNKTTDEINTLNEELKTTEERIRELIKLSDDGTISVADEAELELLKEQNKELTRQIALKQKQQITESKKVLEDAQELSTKDVQSRYTDTRYGEGKDSFKTVAFISPEEEMKLAIERYNELKELLERDDLSESTRERYENELAEAEARAYEMYNIIDAERQAYLDLEDAGYTLDNKSKERLKELNDIDNAYLLFNHTITRTKESFASLNAEQQRSILLNKLLGQGLSKTSAQAVVDAISDDDLSDYWDKDFSFIPPALTDFATAEAYGKAYAEAWYNGIYYGSDEDKIKYQLGFVDNASNAIDGKRNSEINEFYNSLSDSERTIWLNADIPDYVLEGNKADWKAHLDELVELENALLDPFEELLSSHSYKDTRDKLIELSQLGMLDEDSISELEGYEKLLEACGGEIDNLISKVEEYAKTSGSAFGSINTLDTIQGGMGSLESVYNDKFDGDNFVSSDLLSGLYEQFSDLEPFNNFISVMMDMQSTADETQQAFNDLATAYIDSKFNIANLTEANADYVASQYEKLGVTNAEEAVQDRLKYVEAQRTKILEQLAESEQSLAIAKRSGIETSEDLANATWQEITALANEIEAAGQDASYLRALALAKQGVNATTVNTTTDVAQLLTMAKAAGLSAASLTLLENVKENRISSAAAVDSILATAKAEIIKALSDFDIGFSPVGFSYGGGIGGSSGGGGGSSSENETKETFDWIEVKINRLEEAIARLDKTANNTYDNWKNRNTALASEISKVREEINLQQQAYNRYMQEANKVGLSSDYIKKIQSGELNIQTIKDEGLIEKINQYTEW